MKFSRVVGKIDPNLIAQAEDKLTKVFKELALNPDNRQYVSKLGGDPLIFALIVPAVHVATLNIPTAATDGKKFYWNPNFVMKLSYLGNRLVAYHESGHALYLHPQRRGNRNPMLWNIAVDYIVNGMIMDDLKVRLKGDTKAVHDHFTQGLGNYLTIEQCVEMFKNPFQSIKDLPGGENFIPEPAEDNAIELPGPEDDRELTEEEKKEMKKREPKYRAFYADPNLPDNLKKPEAIYNYLLQFLPKCPSCGKIGRYKLPNKDQDKQDQQGKGQKDDQKDQNENDQEDENEDSQGQKKEKSCCGDNQQDGQDDGNGQGQQQPGKGSCSHGSCPTCGGDFDVFDFGGTVDDHMDSEATPEEMAKRLSDAIKTAKQMAGSVPAGLEDELGLLSKPRIRWQDFLRLKLKKTRDGNSRNDWTKYRSRPMAAGLMIPKRMGANCSGGILLDTSGSMSREDRAFGISQLQSLDSNSEMILTCCDCEVYFKDSIKLKKFDIATLQNIKTIGNGGTYLCTYFNEYEQHLGKLDFIVVMTDGFLTEREFVEMRDPGIPVYWLITSNCDFKPPFGKVFMLHNC